MHLPRAVVAEPYVHTHRASPLRVRGVHPDLEGQGVLRRQHQGAGEGELFQQGRATPCSGVDHQLDEGGGRENLLQPRQAPSGDPAVEGEVVTREGDGRAEQRVTGGRTAGTGVGLRVRKGPVTAVLEGVAGQVDPGRAGAGEPAGPVDGHPPRPGRADGGHQ